MKFEVNIDKKYFFILLGTILILAGAIYGYAFGGSEPEVMGHSGNEINVDFNGGTKLLNAALNELNDTLNSISGSPEYYICIEYGNYNNHALPRWRTSIHTEPIFVVLNINTQPAWHQSICYKLFE
jgi:hypothetical protein